MDRGPPAWPGLGEALACLATRFLTSVIGFLE